MGRGVRQGNHLSPYLFILGLEILSIAIRRDHNIKGIDVLGKNIKLAEYADDMNSFLADVKSAKNLFQLLEKFSIISGLNVNKGKKTQMVSG